jgi:hypothetical protein
MDLVQEELDYLMGGLVELLLEEPASCLLKGKLVDISSDDLKFLGLVLALLKLLDDLLHQLFIALRSQMKRYHATAIATMASSRRIRAYFHEGVRCIIATRLAPRGLAIDNEGSPHGRVLVVITPLRRGCGRGCRVPTSDTPWP